MLGGAFMAGAWAVLKLSLGFDVWVLLAPLWVWGVVVFVVGAGLRLADL